MWCHTVAKSYEGFASCGKSLLVLYTKSTEEFYIHLINPIILKSKGSRVIRNRNRSRNLKPQISFLITRNRIFNLQFGLGIAEFIFSTEILAEIYNITKISARIPKFWPILTRIPIWLGYGKDNFFIITNSKQDQYIH